jgi:hypothetical protein
LDLYEFFTNSKDLIESHSEIRYRLVTLLFIRIAILENRLEESINTIRRLYSDDGDKISLLMEFARIVTKFGLTKYLGEAMGALEEIEMRG